MKVEKMPEAAPIIEVESLWRHYRQWKKRPTSLKDVFVQALAQRGRNYEDFWALQDVSFSVNRGEVVGFCGSNGSGKSTLLRTIARILPPSYGRITVRGQIAALLDITAGFHPDLTGRENIALNGSLMGFSRAEIEAKEPSIIEFAELGEFIDQPVKTYSAGMFMRLGFAVASHIETDIILIDEVLAVGDANFQRKCAYWFLNMRQAFRTALIVSHDLPSLHFLCDRVIWLDKGRIMAEGDSYEVLKQYSPEFAPYPDLQGLSRQQIKDLARKNIGKQ